MFPPEIYTEICSFIFDSQTFFNFSLVNKSFSKIGKKFSERNKERFKKIIYNFKYLDSLENKYIVYEVLPNGIKHGFYRVYHKGRDNKLPGGLQKEPKLLFEEYYHSGLKNGNSIVYSKETDLVLSITPYSNGKKDGIVIEIVPSGRKESLYHQDFLMRETSYSQEEFKLKQKIYSHEKNFILEERIKWDNLGRIVSIENFKDKMLHGISKKYYGGILQVKCKYSNDKKQGKYSCYFPNGNIDIICYYENDYLHDRFISYHENGRISERCFYFKGKKQGKSLLWDEKGKFIR